MLINPKDFLLQQRRNDFPLASIKPSDDVEIAEIGVIFPLSWALDDRVFYEKLKEATSLYNQQAALNSQDAIDFDDLHTRYWEYMMALKHFIHI